MAQVGTATEPSALSTVPAVPETDPFADVSSMFGDLGVMPASTGAGMGQIESLTSEIITLLTTMSPEAQAAAADSVANLFMVVAEQVATIDLADPAAVADLQASLSQMMAMAIAGDPDSTLVQFSMLAGIADTAYAAVTIAAFDPAIAGTVIEMVTSKFGELSETFLAVSLGQADFDAVSEGALVELFTLYQGLAGLGAENGIEIISLALEYMPPVDDIMAPAAEGDPTEISEIDDLLGELGLDAAAPVDPMDPMAELPTEISEIDDLLGDLGLDAAAPVDPMDPTAEFQTEFSEIDDLLGDLGLDAAAPVDPTAELPTDETGIDEILPDGEMTEMDDLLSELGLDAEGEEASDEVIPEDVAESGGLSDTSSTDGDPSAQNQANLEARYISLYESLMEKQISFKEAIEPYKTDNQNAGKG